jgi:transposase
MAEKKSTAEATVKNIRRNTRKKYSAEEKIRIVIEGLRGDLPIAELCRREGINQNSYYKWSKEFLAGNTQRQATSEEVKELRKELDQLKLLVAELSLKNRVLKKSLLGLGDETWNE